MLVLAFGAGVIISIVGGFKSFITFAITREVVFPALSIAIAVTDEVPSGICPCKSAV